MYKQNTIELYTSIIKKLEKKTKQENKKNGTNIRYFNALKILAKQCFYNIIFGKRSNGKTTSLYILSLIDYILNNNQLGLVRRWKDDFTGKRGTEMFKNLIKLDIISILTDGKWNNITYRSSQWFLSKFDEELDKEVLDTTPFCLGFALNTSEHDKSISYPFIRTIIFDEFITRKGYINDEFIEFMNVISTIVREKDETTIFMCGNTINKYCPHFNEMGLYNVKSMKPDTIDVYTYGESRLKVAVEYTAVVEEEKRKENLPSDVYFAFNNPKLQMITTGAWEINIYPHLPYKYEKKDIKFTYFIEFDRDILQCEIIKKNKQTFTYIHEKTTPIKNVDKDYIFSQKQSPSLRSSIRINKPKNNIEKIIWWYYKNDKVFYQNNEIGEIVRNYLQWCKSID